MANTATISARQTQRRRQAMWRTIAAVNRELWLILAMFVIALLVSVILAEHRIVLYLYTIPTVLAAYFFGRRHAVLTAFASVFLILAMSWWNPRILSARGLHLTIDGWAEFVTWGGILVITAYLMGTLYERMSTNMHDLRQSYEGMLAILQHVASEKKLGHNHPYRVSLMASKIAEQLALPSERAEDARRAALLHDVEKIGVSKEMLFQAANIREEEQAQIEAHLEAGKELPATKGSSLRRIMPILLAFRAAEEQAQHSRSMPHIPIESKILLAACHYDLLTNAEEKRVAPSEAMERISQRAGIEYDPDVVDAMVKVFRNRGAEGDSPTARVATAKS